MTLVSGPEDMSSALALVQNHLRQTVMVFKHTRIPDLLASLLQIQRSNFKHDLINVSKGWGVNDNDENNILDKHEEELWCMERDTTNNQPTSVLVVGAKLQIEPFKSNLFDVRNWIQPVGCVALVL